MQLDVYVIENIFEKFINLYPLLKKMYNTAR